MAITEDNFRDRQRAESFGSIAEQYDRARPPYPDALILDLVARGPQDVLDVGCGTGKAARLLTARGLPVLGVEIDADMAEVARGHGIDVEVASFEDWDDAGRRFDLLISAQAWHWVDPVPSAQKAARVLHPGGTIALFWNMHEVDKDVRAAMDVVYEREAPELVDGVRKRGERQHRRGVEVTGLEPAGFTDIVVRDYPWQHVYPRDEWLDLLPTYSDHHLLPDDRRAQLLRGVGAVVDQFGGSVTAHYETHTVLARAPR